MKMKIFIAALFLFIINLHLYTQPNFLVKTVNGFDNFRIGKDYAEPYIATNPINPLNSACIFYELSHQSQAYAYYTLDGHDWLGSPLNFGYVGAGGDPFITSDKFGNFYILVTTGLPSMNALSIAKSTNDGVSWSYIRLFEYGMIDKGCITSDITNGPFSGNLYAAWQGIDTAGYMTFSKSTNLGVNWSAELRFRAPTQDFAPFMAVGPNSSTNGGSLFYAHLSADTGIAMEIRVKRSTDGGESFSNGVLAASNVRNPQPIKGFIYSNSCPQMAADNSSGPYRGNVYIVYGQKPDGNDRSDVYFNRSTNYGISWGTPRKLTDENTLTEQWMPSIACDVATGKIFITWFDSRFDPANQEVKLYGTVSTDGGATFAPNTPISNEPYNLAGTNYWGHYMGVSAIKNTSYAVWTDNRERNYGSYTAFYPDYAFTTSHDYKIAGSNDSFNVTLRIPAKNGPFNQSVKFTPSLEIQPPQGSISAVFLNNKDSVTVIPDSVTVRVKTTGVVTPGRYRMVFTSRASDGVPVHKRYLDVLVGYSYLSVTTNRNGLLNFKVNGTSYNNKQEMYLPNGSTVNVQALSPQIITLKKYVFQNWSDAGDTTHNVTLNNDYINLVANYKVQFKVSMDTSFGNTFGGNIYHDSAQTVNFGVLSRTIVYNGQPYRFAGWNGSGLGSYNSPDSTGNDTSVTLPLIGAINQTPRWLSLIGIQPISTEIPAKFNLYNNYPNPFNPVTKIKFDIARLTSTKLIIYDILGRVISMAVNEQLKPGKYELTFEGNALASGVYFYRLETNDFSDTKKMLLIK